MKTINIIGCGKVGKTLGRLWNQRGVLQVEAILSRTRDRAEAAADFVGTGRPVQDYSELPPADVVMIATPDEAIEPCCQRLCRSGRLLPGAVVFHVSGALPSSVLDAARARGATIASVHPVKSFPDPAAAAESFEGTFCAVEGDRPACALLREIVLATGGIPFDVRPDQKTIYHAATVFLSNYLVALVEVGLRCFDRAGVARDEAIRVMGPLVRGTVENVLRRGPAGALTGPIARGESSVVARQCESLGQWDDLMADLYKRLGQVAVQLAQAQRPQLAETLAEIRRLLAS